MKKLTLTRQELYEMVWKLPMTKLAKQYGLSDNGLRKICLKLQIPLPKSGHWTKVQRGKKVTIVALPTGYTGEQEVTLSVGDDGKVIEEGNSSALSLLEHELTKGLGELLVVPQKLKKPHELIEKTKEQLEDKKNRYLDNGLVRHSRDTIAISVSPDNIGRALRFMDTLVKVLIARGHGVQIRYGETIVTVQGEEIEIRLREKLDKSIIKEGRWDRSIYKPSGILIFQIKDIWSKEWADGKHSLEERLPRIVASLELKGMKMHTDRIERDRRHAEKEERERIHRAMEAQQEKELSKLKSLLIETERWEKALKMRAYANSIEQTAIAKGTLVDELKERINWIRKKADWYDPQVKSNDELLTEVDWETLILRKKPSYLFW